MIWYLKLVARLKDRLSSRFAFTETHLLELGEICCEWRAWIASSIENANFNMVPKGFAVLISDVERTVAGMRFLLKELAPVEQLIPHNVSTDPIENWFSQMRHCLGLNSSITAMDYRRSYSTMLLAKGGIDKQTSYSYGDKAVERSMPNVPYCYLKKIGIIISNENAPWSPPAATVHPLDGVDNERARAVLESDRLPDDLMFDSKVGYITGWLVHALTAYSKKGKLAKLVHIGAIADVLSDGNVGRLVKAKEEFIKYIRSIVSVFSEMITMRTLNQLASDALRYASWLIVSSERLKKNWISMLENIIEKETLDGEDWDSAVDVAGVIVRRKLVMCLMNDFLIRNNLCKARGGCPSFRHSI